MVATILKQVTAKGIEAASSATQSSPSPDTIATNNAQNSAPIPSSSAAPITNVTQQSGNPNLNISSSNNVNSSADASQNQMKLTTSFDKDNNNGDIINDEQSSSWLSPSLNQYYNSARDSIYGLTDEASTSVSSLTSFLTPAYTTNNIPSSNGDGNIVNDVPSAGPIDTPLQGGAQEAGKQSSSPAPWLRKLSIKNPYNINLLQRSSTGGIHSYPTGSVAAAKRLSKIIYVEEDSILEDYARSSYNNKNNSNEYDYDDDTEQQERANRFWSPNPTTEASATTPFNRSESFESAPHNIYNLSEEEEQSLSSNEVMIDETDSKSTASAMLHKQPTVRLNYNKKNKKQKLGKAETASRLGEVTVRALRDLALDEALELHYALRYWTERLERPMLYYIESAPYVWLSPSSSSSSSSFTNHHAEVGHKVSQLQAVLARRCSSIGELQQHLWRAGWQRGVAEWGILGGGTEFAAVAGGHENNMVSDESNNNFLQQISNRSLFSIVGGGSARGGDNKKKKSKENYTNPNNYGDALLSVRNSRGGQIIKNDAALAAWSVDAIRVVRDQLYCAGNGTIPLPYYEHWPRERQHFLKGGDTADDTTNGSNQRLGDSMLSIDPAEVFDDSSNDSHYLPMWAVEDVGSSTFEEKAETKTPLPDDITSIESSPILISNPISNEKQIQHKEAKRGDVAIVELGRMAAEVNEILTSMEDCMEKQRERRLDKLKPPPFLLRNWYKAAIILPLIGYAGYYLARENAFLPLAQSIYTKASVFCAEHISEPLRAIYQELFTRKGRQDVTDRKARKDTIDILKQMIQSWLDEYHPDMEESERTRMAKEMDMGLIEATKEDAIKNIFEINNIVRMSLIEMQFIKKEMMNALFAMDELMGSNEINMNLAAITPAFLIASCVKWGFQKIFYALVKVKKSREETYASFRHIILDIERLLVMRDGPPSSPPPLASGINSTSSSNHVSSGKGYTSSHISLPAAHHPESDGMNHTPQSPCVLSSDDLGMLMLLVHECRTILWQDRSRFSRQEIRNVLEDLAELAGERGPVSVQQQLRIIARMCRTYSFLKIVSSGIPFSINDDYILKP